MSTKKSVTINFTLTNRWLYTLIALTLILIVSIGVYATSHPNPGHLVGEVNHPSIISDGILSWGEITNIPIDIADGDDVGSSSWESITNKPSTATRWPIWIEILNRPSTATRWPAWGEITNIPDDIADGDQIGYNTLTDLEAAVVDFHTLGGVDAVHHDNPTHIPTGVSCSTTQDCGIDAGPCYVTSVSCSLTY